MNKTYQSAVLIAVADGINTIELMQTYIISNSTLLCVLFCKHVSQQTNFFLIHSNQPSAQFQLGTFRRKLQKYVVHINY